MKEARRHLGVVSLHRWFIAEEFQVGVCISLSVFDAQLSRAPSLVVEAVLMVFGLPRLKLLDDHVRGPLTEIPWAQRFHAVALNFPRNLHETV